ncbi:MAG TPA: hypothetical protein VGR82_17575 [Methylomirabilota bacterium]|jgi:hypothetical protein|nr:hypothetical protein [Methylomirabilota bacterium]
MGDAASAQASTPATPAPDRPSSADVQALRSTALHTVRDGKHVRTTTAIRVRNVSQQLGFFRGQRVRPGRTFTLPAGEVIGTWMEPVDANEKDDLELAREASPKTRGSAGVVLKNPRQGAGRRSQSSGALETGANTDDGI